MKKTIIDLIDGQKKDKERLQAFLKQQEKKKQQDKKKEETEQEVVFIETEEKITEDKPKRGRKPKNREYLVVEGDTEVKEEAEEE